MRGHQQPRQYRGHRHAEESRDLGDCYVSPARVTGHNFRHVGVDDHNLRADAHAREETHGNQPTSGWRERSRQRERRINQQQGDEGNAAAHAVAAHSEKDGAAKHSEKSGRDEEAELLQRKKSGLLQGGADVGGDENVVEVEEIPQRDQGDESPVKFAERQTLDARTNWRADARRERDHRYFTRSTTPIFSSACKYSSTISTGTGPYSAETASRISCALRLPFAKFRTSYAYSSPPPQSPS